ncbi:MAG: DNA-binding transcriptional regulator CsiR [Natronospirillum sp.]|uniref:DNA-binding transcriptional regulator CsiR n=1 Tax=Natronospirillum sp. TaxID=2812955 RepID=UPI0025F232D6|nr:DNA-binding transcriptional regulator CsiR [Natronospirillum sp.]MCH8551409.1 DNA-binding transcriptional regulator CsiR [Natronospirillum sp.]
MTETARPNQGISAYRWLKRDIIRGHFAPGEKLRMTSLRERYELGTGPLREALSQLVSEHLVVAISQRGYRVAPMSLDELHDIYDARSHMEGLVVELAIQRGDDAWEANVIAQHHTLSKVVDLNSPEEVLSVWDQRHKAFHNAIAEGCGSRHLLQARESLFEQAERYRHLWLQQTVFSTQALATKRREHAELVEVLLARDTERAIPMMRDHLKTPIPIITQVLKDRGIA